MKNFTFKSIFTVLALMLAMTSYSQDRTCGMVEYMEEMLKDPVLAKEYEENQKKFKAELAKRLSADFNARGGAPIIIPVAVHFPTGNPADRACLEALAQSQIDVLNADYTATNADIATWNSISANHVGLDAPGVANIEFCLATSNHPAAVPQLIEGQPAVTIGYDFDSGGFPESNVNFQGYMNFLVTPLGGLLGYSPLGGSVANGGAVVIDTATFGVGAGCAGGIAPSAPYNLGRTTTHELGHFYGLGHTFNADGGGVCGGPGGDGIADTPEVANSTYGCPSNPTPFACNAPERRLTMNYMDYVNDACMYMFTPGQMGNVDAYVSGVLAADFKPNVCNADPGFNIAADNDTESSCPTTDTSVDFTFSYTTIAGFSETTTFSASGAPAGATVNFTPSSLSSDGNFTMTVGNLGATALGTYNITVTGTSNSVTKNVDVTLDNNCTTVVCTDFTATDTPIVIDAAAAGGAMYTSTITVTEDLPIDDINVTLGIDHMWIRDITASITSPDGTTVELTSVNGANGAGAYQNTVFDQEATTPVDGATPAGNNFTGLYIPEGDLSLIYGEMSAGDWVLTVVDNFADDGGNLTNFSIELCLEDNLSVSEFELDGFVIFPNPNNGEFTIKLNSNSGNDIKVDVFDIRGRKIFNNSFTNTGEFNETISLNSIQSGMYLVTVNDGTNEVTKRIIVE